MLDFDPVAALSASLAADRRPPDGLLHPSGDLIGSLRHSQLRAAGAPTIESDVVADTRLMIGTLTHRWLEAAFRSSPVMNEVKLDKWLPDGWSGTADAFFWNAERRAFVLVDYKTIRPEGIPYVMRDGIRDEHMHQLSAYWWAAARMGIPLVRGFGVLYLPTGQTGPRDANVRPTFQEGTPLEREYIEGLMTERWAATKAYLSEVSRTDQFINEFLAPVQERVQKLMPEKRDKPGQRDVVLVPHWSASYCPYPETLCDCRSQGTTKIGAYVDGEYQPRKGYEHVQPTV